MNNKKKNYYHYRSKKKNNRNYNYQNNYYYKKENRHEKEMKDNVIEIKKDDLDIGRKREVFNMKRMAIYVLVPLLLIFILIGTTYAYFNFYQEDTRNSKLFAGEMYVKLSGETPTLNMGNSYPMTIADARASSDNYVDFTILGKNTSTKDMLVYVLQLSDGEDLTAGSKVRIDPQYLMFDLSLLDNSDNETLIIDAVKYSDFNSYELDYFNNIPNNTSNEISNKYRLRMWVSSEVLISDSEPNRTYTSAQYSNLYANVKLSISTYLTKKSFPMTIVNAKRSNIENNMNYFITRISNNYLLTELGENLTENDTISLEVTNDDELLYFYYEDDKGNSSLNSEEETDTLSLDYEFTQNEGFNIKIYAVGQDGLAHDTIVRLKYSINGVIMKEYEQIVNVVEVQ